MLESIIGHGVQHDAAEKAKTFLSEKYFLADKLHIITAVSVLPCIEDGFYVHFVINDANGNLPDDFPQSMQVDIEGMMIDVPIGIEYTSDQIIGYRKP